MFLEGPMENDRSGIFFSQKNATGWSNPLPVSNLNDSKGKIGDKSPCLSRDGIRLYFSSDRPGGQGGLDIYSVAVSDLKLK
jgi:Tol biopolymer transport system component